MVRVFLDSKWVYLDLMTVYGFAVRTPQFVRGVAA